MWAKDRGACCKCRIEEGYGEYDMGHTPGPWVVAGDSIHDRETKYESDGARTGDTACRIATTEIMARQGEQEANARLIAAAPDMLEALEEVMGELDVEGLPCPLCGRNLTIGHRHNCLWHVVASAIRKARGEEWRAKSLK